jgi:hypothetical protein
MRMFAVPTPGGAPHGIAAGTDGNIWFTEVLGNGAGRLELVAPAPAPTIRAEVAPPANAADWHTTAPVAVSLTAAAAPAGAAVQSITYRAAGAQPIASTTVNGASATIQLTMEGVTTLSYFATDRAGNREAAKALVVRIDTAAPHLRETVRFGPDGAYAGTD